MPRSWFYTKTAAEFIPYILISATNSKLVCFGWVDIDGVQTNLFIPFLHNDQFTAIKITKDKH